MKTDRRLNMLFKVLLIVALTMVAEVNSFYVHYFAFGANMNPDLLEKRTFSKTGSLTFERAVLQDYQLVFNTGLKAIGMAASAEPNKGSNLHGLCYKLNLNQFTALLASEGFPVGYKVESVNVRPYGGAGRIAALTLRSGNGLISEKPSERYVKLLQNGARENNLDPAYLTYLDSIVPTTSFISRMRT